MRLTLAFLGLAAFANAAVIATPVPTVNGEAGAGEISPRRVGNFAACNRSNGPGWSGFLKVHSAFTKIWAKTPAGFCVAGNNWACVQCDGAYLYFQPNIAANAITCRTSAQFGEAATVFNGAARAGESHCVVTDGVPYAWNGYWGFGSITDGGVQGCLNRC